MGDTTQKLYKTNFFSSFKTINVFYKQKQFLLHNRRHLKNALILFYYEALILVSNFMLYESMQIKYVLNNASFDV